MEEKCITVSTVSHGFTESQDTYKNISDVYNILKMARRKQVRSLEGYDLKGTTKQTLRSKGKITTTWEGKKDSTGYLPCVKCRRWFAKSRLTNHSKICARGKECTGAK